MSLYLLAQYGARTENAYFKSTMDCLIGTIYLAGLREMPETARNVSRWIAKGLVVASLKTIGFVGIAFPLAMAIFSVLAIATAYLAFAITAIALVYFFKFIHCAERVACAFDGTLGGLIMFIITRAVLAAPTTPELIMSTICGGLLGVALGHLNYYAIKACADKLQVPLWLIGKGKRTVSQES